MPLYDEVVAAVQAALGFENDLAGFAAHLETLAPGLHALRESYRTGGGSVSVDYSAAVTEAYMLAYFPHYVGLSALALSVLPAGALPDVDRLRVSAFGSGPAPEPIAVAQHLVTADYGTTTLALALFDRVPDQWAWARTVSIDRVLPLYWDREVVVAETAAVDITATGFVDSVRTFVSRSDLVLFQNCLNEFRPDQVQVAENAGVLIAAMKPGACLVMADLDYYPTARECLYTFARVSEASGASLLHDPSVVLEVPTAVPRPAVLDAHFFFREGEWPRRRPYAIRCLAVQV